MLNFYFFINLLFGILKIGILFQNFAFFFGILRFWVFQGEGRYVPNFCFIKKGLNKNLKGDTKSTLC